jgi:hypothetical protein
MATNFVIFFSVPFVEGPTDLPPNPTLELSQLSNSSGDGIKKCHVREMKREILFGQNFTLFCNVTPRNDHNLKIEWFKDVS